MRIRHLALSFVVLALLFPESQAIAQRGGSRGVRRWRPTRWRRCTTRWRRWRQCPRSGGGGVGGGGQQRGGGPGGGGGGFGGGLSSGKSAGNLQRSNAGAETFGGGAGGFSARPGAGSGGAGRTGIGAGWRRSARCWSGRRGTPGVGAGGAGRPGAGVAGAGRPGVGAGGAGEPGVGAGAAQGDRVRCWCRRSARCWSGRCRDDQKSVQEAAQEDRVLALQVQVGQVSELVAQVNRALVRAA